MSSAVHVAQFESWVGHRVGDPRRGERWANGADQHSRVSAVPEDDESANHDVAFRADRAARADVGQGRIGRRVQIVRFDQSGAGCAIAPAHDRGVSARGQGPDDRRFQLVRRRNAGRFDLSLLRVGPVIVRRDDRAGVVAQFQGRVRQRSANSRCDERRTDRADDDLSSAGFRSR